MTLQIADFTLQIELQIFECGCAMALMDSGAL